MIIVIKKSRLYLKFKTPQASHTKRLSRHTAPRIVLDDVSAFTGQQVDISSTMLDPHPSSATWSTSRPHRSNCLRILHLQRRSTSKLSADLSRPKVSDALHACRTECNPNLTRRSENDSTIGRPSSGNVSISWVWPFHTVIRFMVNCIMPPNFRS